MREKKYHIYLTDDEQSRVIQSLINLKNNLIVQGRYTDAVDEVLLKVLSARKKETENQIISSIYAVCFLTETGGFFVVKIFLKFFLEKQRFWVSKMKPFVQ